MCEGTCEGILVTLQELTLLMRLELLRTTAYCTARAAAEPKKKQTVCVSLLMLCGHVLFYNKGTEDVAAHHTTSAAGRNCGQ